MRLSVSLRPVESVAVTETLMVPFGRPRRVIVALAPFADAAFLPLTVAATDFTVTPAGGLIFTVPVRRLTQVLAGGSETSCSAVTLVLGSAAGGAGGADVTGGGVTGGAVGVGDRGLDKTPRLHARD